MFADGQINAYFCMLRTDLRVTPENSQEDLEYQSFTLNYSTCVFHKTRYILMLIIFD